MNCLAPTLHCVINKSWNSLSARSCHPEHPVESTWWWMIFPRSLGVSLLFALLFHLLVFAEVGVDVMAELGPGHHHWGRWRTSRLFICNGTISFDIYVASDREFVGRRPPSSSGTYVWSMKSWNIVYMITLSESALHWPWLTTSRSVAKIIHLTLPLRPLIGVPSICLSLSVSFWSPPEYCWLCRYWCPSRSRPQFRKPPFIPNHLTPPLPHQGLYSTKVFMSSINLNGKPSSWGRRGNCALIPPSPVIFLSFRQVELSY